MKHIQFKFSRNKCLIERFFDQKGSTYKNYFNFNVKYAATCFNSSNSITMLKK